MPENIFKNRLSLTLSNKYSEIEYQNIRNDKLLCFSTPIIIFSVLSSFIIMIFQYYLYEENQEVVLFKLNVIMTTIACITYILLLIIRIFTRKIKILRFINYFIFYFQIFVIIAFRYAIFRVVSTTQLLLFLEYLMETTVRLICVVGYIHSFYESFFLNLFSLATVWLIIIPLIPQKFYDSEISNTINYTLVIIAVTAISYVLERQMKIAFFYRLHITSKVKRLTNSFENLKSGFVSLKNGQISFLNKHLKEILSNGKFKEKVDERRRSILTNRFTEVNQLLNLDYERHESSDRQLNFRKDSKIDLVDLEASHLNDSLYNLITSLNFDALDDKNTKYIMYKFLEEMSSMPSMNTDSPTYKTTSKYSSVFNLLSANISQLPEIENFTHIGEISFSREGQDYYYEVNCRLNNFEHTEETELLFNDITRTRIKEKENQEYKHKSLYFSKVIHEFKNPLICICELVNQTQDIITTSKPGNFNSTNNSFSNLTSNLNEISSLANFLQILIKDFTHLTQSQFQKNTDVFEYNNHETDVGSVVDFCSRIGKTLLKKYEKNDKVEFKFNIDSQVPNKILTDEWKLKQILVNLISNSIKFTFNGRISLDLSLEKLDESTDLIENPNLKDKRGFLGTNSNNFNSNPYRLKIAVKDSGVGMSEEIVNNLSKPFKMENNILSIISNKSINDKKYNEFGSGLGLSIAYEMTSKLGSRLECESSVGNGTSFWFHIPVQKEREPSSNKYEIIVNVEPEPSQPVPYSYRVEEGKNLNKLDCIHQGFRKSSNSSFKSFNTDSTKKIINLCLNKPLGMEEIYNSYNIETEIPQFQDQMTNFINIIVCDDESLVRQSTIRTINNVCKSLNMNINIIETVDGVETLSFVYNYLKSGNKISLIFSDENMVCMNGRASSELIHQVIQTKKSVEIPFYLLTAGDTNIPIQTIHSSEHIPVIHFPVDEKSILGLESNHINRMNHMNHTTKHIGITKVLEKPLARNVALEIFKKFK